MAKAVAKPIPLRAGRWSAHPRSKGNFVYSFDGSIPFDIISSYEHILLQPFHGSGQLRPSLGWTRLLAHGVPIMDNGGMVFGPDALMEEIKTLEGLDKIYFAMPPRWLKPVERVQGPYSTVTFAISDPDGTLTDTLLRNRLALFGKEIMVRRWIDKPALVQCSHCHALGHSKVSKSCPLGKDSVKCYICGGTHRSEEHDQHCTQNHAVAGLCDCPLRCLSCQITGHNCRDHRCPARELFRPKVPRKAGKAKERGVAANATRMAEASAPEREPNTMEDQQSFPRPPSPRPPSPLPQNATRAQKTAHRNQTYKYFMNNVYRQDEETPRGDYVDEDEPMGSEDDPFRNFLPDEAQDGVNYVAGEYDYCYPETPGSQPTAAGSRLNEPNNHPREPGRHSPSRPFGGADTANHE